LVLRLGLNAGGPYFRDRWTHQYRRRTVAALSAFLGFLLAAAVLCLAYHYCCRPQADRPTGELADFDGGTGVRMVAVVSTAITRASSDWPSSSQPPTGAVLGCKDTRVCTEQL